MVIIANLLALALIIFSIVIVWRIMKALESIAESFSKTANKP
jgi:hypothetical protein